MPHWGTTDNVHLGRNARSDLLLRRGQGCAYTQKDTLMSRTWLLIPAICVALTGCHSQSGMSDNSSISGTYRSLTPDDVSYFVFNSDGTFDDEPNGGAKSSDPFIFPIQGTYQREGDTIRLYASSSQIGFLTIKYGDNVVCLGGGTDVCFQR